MYGRQYGRGVGDDIKRMLGRDGAPITMTLISANVLTFLLAFFLSGSQAADAVDRFLAFNFAQAGGPVGGTFPAFFWTLVTWPLIGPISPLALLFGSLFFFWIGSSLERSWGARVFGGFLAATAALTALGLFVGALITGRPVHASGVWTASVPVLVAWAAINRRESINLYGIFPISAPIMAWVSVALLMVNYGLGAPLLGLFALTGCAAAYWYVTKGRYARGGFEAFRTDAQPRRTSIFSRPTTPPRTNASREDVPSSASGGFNPLRRLKEERERRAREKSLEEMFRRSGYSDDETKRR